MGRSATHHLRNRHERCSNCACATNRHRPGERWPSYRVRHLERRRLHLGAPRSSVALKRSATVPNSVANNCHSGGGIRTRDLRGMSPTSYQTAPPRVARHVLAKIRLVQKARASHPAKRRAHTECRWRPGASRDRRAYAHGTTRTLAGPHARADARSRARGTQTAQNTTGAPSLKNPPVGPSSGKVASHTIPAAPSSTGF
jgi:hypothetical protein